VAVAVGVLAAGCATKGFVREEIQKSEGRLDQQVGKLQGDLGQEQTRVTGVIAQAGEARKVADEATRLATDAASRANDAGARAAESSALAGKALAKAEDTDGRLTRLWGARNKWIPADTFTVTFGFDKWRLDDRAETAVLDAVKQLQANPGLIAALEGYSDTTGSPAHNLQLSQRRVEAVRRFLVEKGVDLHRVQSIGLGGVRPVADNKTKQGRAQNRRVTIKLFAPAE
jgi:outer membrane protein OmpA-like peptidoglycan-associated protein